MSKPRYDPEENRSRHAATDEACCLEMARKYGWELIQIEETPDEPIFKVDCVFKGETEFPRSFYNTSEEQ